MGMVIIYNKTMCLFLSEAAYSSIMLSVCKVLVTSFSINKIARLESLSSFILVLSLVSILLRVEKDLSLSALVTAMLRQFAPISRVSNKQIGG